MAEWTRGGFVGATRRRRTSRQPGEDPLITLPRAHGTYVVFDAHAFRNAMNVLIARARDPFTVLILRSPLPDTTLRLAEVAVGELRAGSGDLAGCLESAVAVVLNDSRSDGARRYHDRVRQAWQRIGGGDLLVEMAEHPREEQRAIELLTADWSENACATFD